MDRRITIYSRKDGIYVIPDGITTIGANLHTEPFEYLPCNSEPEEIWNAVERALSNANRRVSHPKSWNFITAWYQKAGVKSWGQFAGRAKAISVAEDDENYTIKSHRWERGSLISQTETTEVFPKSVLKNQLAEAITRRL